MKIILLYGASGSGKTTTLNDVFNRLSSQQIQNVHKVPIKFGSNNDFEADFVYQNKLIGIFSLGDTLSAVGNAIERYEKLKVNVFITACNNKFLYLPWQLSKATEIQIVTKSSNNQTDCNLIISKI